MQEQIQSYFDRIHAIIEKSETTKAGSLMSGGIGLSLYYYTLYKKTSQNNFAEKAVQLIEAAIDQLNDTENAPPVYTYSNGLTGMLYVLHLLQKEELLELDLDDFAALDTYLFETAQKWIVETKNNDFLHGTMGIVHYFISRLPSPEIEKYLTTLLHSFCNAVVTEPEGTWFVNTSFPTDRIEMINFGLAHGQSGFLILLMQAYDKGIKIERIPELVKNGLDLILLHRLTISKEKKQYSMFSNLINSTDKNDYYSSNRLAWCYGDLNMVLVLYHAAKLLQKPVWTDLANTLGAETMNRTNFESTLVSDTHFCHGASGLAQFYKHLYDISKEESYKESWHYWLKQSLKMLPLELENNFYKDKEVNLLEGLVGVNLCLLSFLSKEPLNWGRIFLL